MERCRLSVGEGRIDPKKKVGQAFLRNWFDQPLWKPCPLERTLLIVEIRRDCLLIYADWGSDSPKRAANASLAPGPSFFRCFSHSVVISIACLAGLVFFTRTFFALRDLIICSCKGESFLISLALFITLVPICTFIYLISVITHNPQIRLWDCNISMPEGQFWV